MYEPSRGRVREERPEVAVLIVARAYPEDRKLHGIKLTAVR
jgi:hypothetical protein